MSRLKIIILTLIVISLIGFITLKTISKSYRNVDTILGRISNFLNDNNKFSIETIGVDNDKLEIIWKSEVNEKTIYSHGKQINKIGHEYGANSLEIRIDNKNFTVGHFKTANWMSHEYYVKFIKNTEGYVIHFIADGTFYIHSVKEYDLKQQLNGFSRSFCKNGNLSDATLYVHDKLKSHKSYNKCI